MTSQYRGIMAGHPNSSDDEVWGGPPDFSIDLSRKPDVLSVEQTKAIDRSETAVLEFVEQVKATRAAAELAEQLLHEAGEAGVLPEMLADRLPLSVDSLQRILAREQPLFPDLM